MVDGFSSADPSLARGSQEVVTRGGSSGGRGSSRSKGQKVNIRGGTVLIDGVGFSVAPSLQAGFIKRKTGGRGTSARSAIAQAAREASSIEADRAAREQLQRQEEIQRKEQSSRQSVIAQQLQTKRGIQALESFQQVIPSQRQSRADGIRQRVKALETTERRLPTSSKDTVLTGRPVDDVSSLKDIETTTGTDRRAQPLSIEAFDPRTFSEARGSDAARLTGKQAITAIVKGETLKPTGQAIRDLVSLEEGASLANVIEEFIGPLKKTGKRTGDIKVQIPQFGTVTQEYPTGIKEISLFDLEKESQLERGTDIALLGLSKEARVTGGVTKKARGIQKKFQSKVTSGELTVDQAQAAAQKEFTEVAQDIVSFESPSANLQKRSTSQRAVKTAAIAAEVALGIGLAAATPGAQARSIDTLALKELAETKPTRFVGTVTDDIDAAVIKLVGKKQTPVAKQTVGLSGRVFDLGEVDDISRAAIRGRGKAVTELDSFAKRIGGFKGKQATITSIDDFALVGRGKSKKAFADIDIGGVPRQAKVIQTRGSLDILPEKRMVKEFQAFDTKRVKKKTLLPQLADPDSIFASRVVSVKPVSVTKQLKGRKTTRFIGASEEFKDDVAAFIGGKPRKVKIAVPSGRVTSVADIDSIGRIRRVPKTKSKGGVSVAVDILDSGKPSGARAVSLKRASKMIDLDQAVKTVSPGVTTTARQVSVPRSLVPRQSIEEFVGVTAIPQTQRTVRRQAPTAKNLAKEKLVFQARQAVDIDSAFRPKTKVIAKQKFRGRSRQKRKQFFDAASEFDLREAVGLATAQPQRFKQRQKQRVISQSFSSLVGEFGLGRASPSFGFKIKPKLAFDLDSELSATGRKKKRRRGDEAEFFTPGFTEKILGIRKKITRKEAARIARSGDPFSERAIPLFVD